MVPPNSLQRDPKCAELCVCVCEREKRRGVMPPQLFCKIQQTAIRLQTSAERVRTGNTGNACVNVLEPVGEITRGHMEHQKADRMVSAEAAGAQPAKGCHLNYKGGGAAVAKGPVNSPNAALRGAVHVAPRQQNS